MRNHIEPKAIDSIFAASGVTATRDDVEAVARSLARIDQAAAVLFSGLSFDETVERFYRLLDAFAEKGAGRG